MGPRMFHEFAAQSDTPTYKAGHQLPKGSGTEPEAGHHAEVYGKWEQLLPLLGVVRLLLWVARPLLACPLQEEPGGYLPVHSFAFRRQPFLLHLDVTSSSLCCLSRAAFLQHGSVKKLKEYSYRR